MDRELALAIQLSIQQSVFDQARRDSHHKSFSNLFEIHCDFCNSSTFSFSETNNTCLKCGKIATESSDGQTEEHQWKIVHHSPLVEEPKPFSIAIRPTIGTFHSYSS